VPVSELPAAMADVVRFLPSTALADVLRESLAGTGMWPGSSWWVLAAWAVATPTLAATTFRWW
jgi:ABC-type multidrug transport system permease subunit